MSRAYSKFPIWGAMLLMLLCLLPTMLLRDFTAGNELRYLSIADESLRTGHFFAFTNHGLAYADKPPLYLWIVIACRVLFGKHCMLALSLCSFIPACIIIRVMDSWICDACEGNLSGGERMASALMLGTTGLFLGMSIFLRMDMLMVMFIVLALRSFTKEMPGAAGCWTFMALFTKGPVGLFVPPLCAAVWLLMHGRGRDIKRAMGLKYWLIIIVLSALWLLGVWLDGGKEYMQNLLVHQTVGRAVNSFHHKQPLWYYFEIIWGVIAPYTFLTIPALFVALADRKGRTETEDIFAWVVLITFIMLCCFSSKLAIYLAPLFPFITYIVPLQVERKGWKGWMRLGIWIPSLIYIALGAALVGAVIWFDRIPMLQDYSFACCWNTIVAGSLLMLGGLMALLSSGKSFAFPTTMLASTLLFAVLSGSLKMEQINDYVGYGNICTEVPAEVPVYTINAFRPENMDVYLGRDVNIINTRHGDWLQDIPAEAAIISPKKYKSSVLAGRKTITRGDYTLWLPRK